MCAAVLAPICLAAREGVPSTITVIMPEEPAQVQPAFERVLPAHCHVDSLSRYPLAQEIAVAAVG
ncbi:MAG: hypothetical protein A2Z18_05045 [Armatimonadetes bacterium RBG_16_58_9]|nr:MAG: hypothetical protein A2Z18_05045 [Armatimonadetes bacterium RBG_16_58_9]